MVIGIIGGGASGMAAALAAAENPENRVILLERQARLGRKLSATGNGRCNLSNLHAAQGGYHGEEADFWRFALEAFPPERTLRWFRELGLFTAAEPSGRVYPYSDQANSVVDILRFSLEKQNITVKTGFEAERIRREGGLFRVESREEGVSCQRLIIACGGLAGTALGGGMSGYRLLRSLGHHATRLRPALVQLKTDWSGAAALKGVRAQCRAEIIHGGVKVGEDTGEVQFTDYGLSGPLIFGLSRDVCQGSGGWLCRLDFLPGTEEETLKKELFRRRGTGLPASELLTGILHNRLGRVLAKAAGASQQGKISELSAESLIQTAKIVKCLELPLTGTMGMDCAQVTAGGIRTEEFEDKTMESRLVPGLYACGEVLDVDGDCGGYNLQWAWSSGYLAGHSAGEEGL